MVLLSGIVDFIDGIDYIDDILHWNRLVGTEHDGGVGLTVDLGADAAGKFFVSDRGLVNIILEEVVDVYGDGLFGHGLAVAGWQQ